MKTTRITRTLYLRSGYGEEDIDVKSFLDAIVVSDDAGHIVKETHFDENETANSVVVNEYDGDGNVVSSSQFDENEELTQNNTFTYEDGKCVKKSCFYGEYSPEYSTHYIYENGLMVREDSFDEDDFDYTEKKHEYDSNGLEIRTLEFNEDGDILYRTTNEYDAAGRLTRRLREEPQEHDSRTFTFEYDEAGRKTKELLYNFDEKLIAKTYYTYNADGNVEELEEENLDVYRRTHYTYDGSQVVKIEQFDRKCLLAWTEVAYDEAGNMTSTKNFTQDEVNPEKFRLASALTYEYEL